MDNFEAEGVSGALPIAPSEGGVTDRVASFTRITSSVPAEVSKVFALEDDRVTKSVSAHISQGTLERLSCRDLSEFATVLSGLQRNQCLMYGVAGRDRLNLMTDAAWTAAGRPATAVSRTEANVRWARGDVGVLMLDHDPQPGMQAHPPADLVELLRREVPELADVDMLTWPSASSLIFNRDTGEVVNPLKGSRVYILVEDAEAIPAWGGYIVEMMWAAGYGVFTVSKAGRLLERGLFDTAVWQPSRIDFAGGAICRAPLEQRRGEPILHEGLHRRLASRVDGRIEPVPRSLNDSEVEKVAEHKGRARIAKAAEAEAAAARFILEQGAKIEKAGLILGRPAEVARSRAIADVQAMLRQDRPELHGDVAVQVVRRNGQVEEVSVDAILQRKDEFNGLKTLDPIEPDYNGGHVVGKLFLTGPVPTLHSFAHGGSTYKLVGQTGAVEVAVGALHRAVDDTLDRLRDAGDLYDYGDALATVSADGALVTITKGLLQYTLSSRINFYRNKFDAKRGRWLRFEEDPAPSICSSVYELGENRKLPRLSAVITAPIIVGDRLLLRSGFDATSGLLLVLPANAHSTAVPTDLQAVQRAFHRLLARFETFPFDTPNDLAVFLAALFTAVLRPGLRAAPGFAFDAPAQGTGKSLLSECVAIVGTGSAPSSLPHLHDDEPEVRKRVVSLLFKGAPAMIWDNIKGAFDSPTLASLLTTERFNDRLLGETRLLTLPNRMLALFNGNNMMLRGELTRRILTCRLDAKMERPYLRRFSLSPRETCTRERQDIVRDVLTMVRGYQLNGKSFASTISLGSFEEWSAAVVRPILWLANTFDTGLLVGDPLAKLTASEDDDDDLAALLELHRAWHDVFGEEPTTAGEAIDTAYETGSLAGLPSQEAATNRLRKAIEDFLPGSHTRWNERARELGKQLGYRRGRVVAGTRRFIRLDQRASGGVRKWVAQLDGGASKS